MESFVFSRWEAIEIFAKIVAKFEEKSSQEVENDLLKYLNKYKRANMSAEVAKKALQPIADSLGSQHYYPNFLSDLSLEIKKGVQMKRSENRLSLILEYIDEGEQINRYQALSAVDNKQKSLEKSCWWMYTCEHYIDESSQERKSLITRDSVLLSYFGYASSTTTKTHNDEIIGQQYYSGQYHVKNNRYLFLDMRATDTKDKEAKAIIDIGSGISHVGDMFTGYYMSAGNNLYFGPVLFERIENNKHLSAQIFVENDSRLHEAVHRFFEGMKTIPYKTISSFGAKTSIEKFLKF